MWWASRPAIMGCGYLREPDLLVVAMYVSEGSAKNRLVPILT